MLYTLLILRSFSSCLWGSRITRFLLESDRTMACLIHQEAYVLKRTFLRIVVLGHGAHETDVAFLDEIEDGHLGGEVVLGDPHDQAEVALDELPPGTFIALLDPARKRELLLETSGASRP